MHAAPIRALLYLESWLKGLRLTAYGLRFDSSTIIALELAEISWPYFKWRGLETSSNSEPNWDSYWDSDSGCCRCRC